MSQRARKFFGTIALIVFVAVYALVVMALAGSRLPAIGGLVALAFYAGAGLLWVPPAALIIGWMQRP